MQISTPKKPQGTAALYVSLHTEKSGGVERSIKTRAVARGECAPYHGFIFYILVRPIMKSTVQPKPSASKMILTSFGEKVPFFHS